jgi:hypothetical protein
MFCLLVELHMEARQRCRNCFLQNMADMDKQYEEHRSIADEEHKPDTCNHGKNFHVQWTRTIEEQARRNVNSLREQNEMVLIDLMILSKNQKIVADVLYTPDFTQDIIDYNQILFLTVDKSMIRDGYFNRPEKRDFYEYVKSQELADVYFENIFQSLELTNELEQKMMKDSGFYVIERTKETTVQKMLQQIESHFGLSSKM